MQQLYGICTWTLGIKNLNTLMETISQLGLNAVQYCEPMDAYAAEDVKKAADKYDLALLIYDPFDCRPSDKNGEATLDNAVAFYKRAIDYAAKLGVGQTLQGLSAWTENTHNSTEAWQFMVEALKQIHSYAKTKAVPLSYEPCNIYEVPYIHTFQEFQRLMTLADTPDIAVLLDSFHMNIGEKEPLKVLRQYGQKNSIFHISGSNREGIGQGHLDFKSYHDALYASGFNGPCVMEFVLKTNNVNMPPRNNEEMAELSRQVKESLMLWKSYSEEKAPVTA